MRATLAALAVLCLLAIPAAAQEAAVIDGATIFGAYRPVIEELAYMVIAALVAWVAAWLRTKFKLEVEANHRAAVQTALQNAAGLLINRAGSAAGAVKIDAGSPAINEAVTYVLTSVPDALAYFGVTPDEIRKKVEAKLGIQAAAAEIANVPDPEPAA